MSDNDSSAESNRPIPAATTMLVRDGDAGIEVFMVARHQKIDRFAGALVFPGGKIEPRDNEAGLRDYCRGQEKWSNEVLSLRVAAVREAFEESGVLLARDRKTGATLDADRMSELQGYRVELEEDHTTLLTLIREEHLELATDELVPFSRWTTPPVSVKRFDTHFFLAPVPIDYQLLHCGRETVDSLWSTPRQLLADAESGSWNIAFPTRANLSRLGMFETTREAIRASSEQPPKTVSPHVERSDQGTTVSIPADAGFPVHRQFIPAAS